MPRTSSSRRSPPACSTPLDLYGVAFTDANRDGHPLEGMGPSWLYVAASDGRVVAPDPIGRGTAGDAFVQSQFSLHSGHLLGIPRRLLVALSGLGVAMLSITGVYLVVAHAAQPDDGCRTMRCSATGAVALHRPDRRCERRPTVPPTLGTLSAAPEAASVRLRHDKG